MDDHQLLFEIDVMIRAEKLRPLSDDPRDGYYSADHIKKLEAIHARFKELTEAEYDRKLQELLARRRSIAD